MALLHAEPKAQTGGENLRLRHRQIRCVACSETTNNNSAAALLHNKATQREVGSRILTVSARRSIINSKKVKAKHRSSGESGLHGGQRIASGQRLRQQFSFG
ncbi:Uncharacterised protein [Cedecea neteri]|uniref:Uncharacterized protein n=1 Tax=Cedecea neteri TaxID=158822 RepID=A0A2X3JAQ8_9ENTR|nr:Uncharacterised protein [Cedecea neteri]